MSMFYRVAANRLAPDEDRLLLNGTLDAYRRCNRLRNSLGLPARPLPTRNISRQLLAHIKRFPGSDNYLAFNHWVAGLHLLCTAEGILDLSAWSNHEFAWLATHPLAEIIRRPIVAAWWIQKLLPDTPAGLVPVLLEAMLSYGQHVEGAPGYTKARMELSVGERTLSRLPAAEVSAYGSALHDSIQSMFPVVDAIPSIVGGRNYARTEPAHMLLSAPIQLRSMMQGSKMMREQLLDTVAVLRFLVIDDEAFWVERFMDVCEDISKHQPGYVLGNIKENDYDLLVVNQLIPGSEGGMHFIDQLHSKAKSEGWRRVPVIIMHSSSVFLYQEEMEARVRDGRIQAYVNKADFDYDTMDHLIRRLMPEKYQSI